MAIDNKVLENKLRERIRGELVELIPDDQWTELLTSEVKHFCTHTVTQPGDFGNRRELPSTIRQVAQEILREEAKTRLMAMLEEPEWATMWVEGREIAGKRIKDMIREQGAAMFVSMIEGAIAHQVSDLRTRLEASGISML